MDKDLSQLHDIHMPEAIGWWPLAPGWYLLVTGLVLTGALITFLFRRYYMNGRAKRKALRTLEAIQQQYLQDNNSQLCSAAISELLKRVALAYYPRTRVASLQGDAWMVFLNETAEGVDFNDVRTLLLELPWQPPRPHNLQPLFNTAREWISMQGKPCLN